MPRSLFRKEAIDAQRQKFLGEASVAQPVQGWIYTAVAVGIAATVVAIAVWGQYQRRERVAGFLSNAVGAAVVKMPDSGTIAELMVKEGDVVTAGAPLARLTVDRAGVNDEQGNALIVGQIESRKRSLEQERRDAQTLGEQQIDQTRRRVSALSEDIRQADGEIRLQNDRLESARRVLKVWTDMGEVNRDFVSPIYLEQKKADVKEQEIRLQQLRRQRSGLEGNLSSAQSDVLTAQSRTRTTLEQVDQRASEVSQQAAEQRVRREQSVRRDMLVSAPIDGTVTNVGPAKGQTVAADTQLATLLPKDAALHAELLVPTRAIGFVHPGQSVTLRYEAFPYERFGQFHGHVENVGKTVWTAGDSVGPLAVHEPVYRIIVVLDSQTIPAAGDAFPLRSGMVASADLLMEKRTLLEWLFQPVLQLRERMRSVASAPSTAPA